MDGRKWDEVDESALVIPTYRKLKPKLEEVLALCMTARKAQAKDFGSDSEAFEEVDIFARRVKAFIKSLEIEWNL